MPDAHAAWAGTPSWTPKPSDPARGLTPGESLVAQDDPPPGGSRVGAPPPGLGENAPSSWRQPVAAVSPRGEQPSLVSHEPVLERLNPSPVDARGPPFARTRLQARAGSLDGSPVPSGSLLPRLVKEPSPLGFAAPRVPQVGCYPRREDRGVGAAAHVATTPRPSSWSSRLVGPQDLGLPSTSGVLCPLLTALGASRPVARPIVVNGPDPPRDLPR